MKLKNLWLLVICLGLLFIPSCKDNGNNNNSEEDALKELLKDEEGATTFRVYFNYMDGSEYQETQVALNKLAVRPTTPVRNGYKFIGWYEDKNGAIPYVFSTPVTKSIMLYAIWEEIPFVDYSGLLDELVPDTVYEDFELPKRHPENSDIRLAWTSSDPYTVSPTGIVNPGYETETVTLTMEVIEDGYSTVFSKEVEVEPVVFRKLQPQRTIFGYYASYNFRKYSESQLKCNVINLSFAYVNSDFSLDMHSLSDSIIYGAMAARKQGVRVVLSVQGYGDNSLNFSNAAKNEENRKIFIQNIVNVVEKYNFDGIDLDWEYPGWFTPEIKDSEAEEYTALCKELYEALKAINPELLLTAALPGGTEGYKRYDLAECSKYLDYIHLMTYDLEASSKIYHHTALYSNVGKATATQASVHDSVELFKFSGVPASKIVIGIAFYGKYVTPTSSTNGGLGSDSKNGKYSTIPYSSISRMFLSKLGNGVTYYWDDTCKAPYLYDSDNKYFVTYENEQSISEKTKYMRNNELAGVMIWELGEDDEDNTLMKAVVKGMR